MSIVLDRLAAQDAVDLIVANLPAEQAEVLVLRILGDLDVAHVAQLLGRTPNWVRVAQHRALRRLAQVLDATQDGAVAAAAHASAISSADL